MIIVHDNSTISQISSTAIRELVQKRIDDFASDDFDSFSLGFFVVVEPRDSIQAIHAQVGFNILHNRFTGVRYDQTDFTPSFEFIEELPSCFDMVFILSDDGYGVELFIPKEDCIEPCLLAMCQMFSFKEGSN